MRRFFFPLVALLLVSVYWFSPKTGRQSASTSVAPASSPRPRAPLAAPGDLPPPPELRAASAPVSPPATIPSAAAPASTPAPAFDPVNFPLAAPLNAPNSNIHGDLDALRQILEAWRTNFARQGNPVGENAEIAAALSGSNAQELVLIPKAHPALNARGELVDRWGTPFRFHALSGERMEISSAGPDRKFGTEDDARWSPP